MDSTAVSFAERSDIRWFAREAYSKHYENYDKLGIAFQKEMYKTFLKKNKTKYRLSKRLIKYLLGLVHSHGTWNTRKYENMYISQIEHLSADLQYEILFEMQNFYFSRLAANSFLLNDVHYIKLGKLKRRPVLAVIRHVNNLYRDYLKSTPYQLPYVKDKISNDQCSVCCEEFTEKSVVLQLACKHAFHYRCLSTWLERKTCCPLCRREVVAFCKHNYSYKSRLNANGCIEITISLTYEARYY